MTYICAWCKTLLPAHDSNGDKRVSHGICEPCALVQLPSHLHAEFLRERRNTMARQQEDSVSVGNGGRLVHYWSRINGKVKTDTALWSPQLTDAEIAAELADLAPVDPRMSPRGMAQEVMA